MQVLIPSALLPGVDHLPHTHGVAGNLLSKGEPEHGAHLAELREGEPEPAHRAGQVRRPEPLPLHLGAQLGEGALQARDVTPHRRELLLAHESHAFGGAVDITGSGDVAGDGGTAGQEIAHD